MFLPRTDPSKPTRMFWTTTCSGSLAAVAGAPGAGLADGWDAGASARAKVQVRARIARAAIGAARRPWGLIMGLTSRPQILPAGRGFRKERPEEGAQKKGTPGVRALFWPCGVRLPRSRGRWRWKSRSGGSPEPCGGPRYDVATSLTVH